MPIEELSCPDISRELLRRLGGSPGPFLEETARKMARLARALGEPRFSWKLYHLSPAGENQDTVILLRRGEPRGELHLGEGVRYLREASRGFVGICTLGPFLEAEAERIQEKEKLLDAYLLTLGGNLLLDAVSRRAREKAREIGQTEGERLGPTLLPGSLRGWAVEEQERLLSLGGAENLGVRRSSGGMLSPLQSLSFLIGLGNYPPETPETLCQECLRRESCPWRREE